MGFIKSIKNKTQDAGSAITKTVIQPIQLAAPLHAVAAVAPLQNTAVATVAAVQKQVIQPVIAPVQAVVLPVVKVVSEPTKTFAAVSKTINNNVISPVTQVAAITSQVITSQVIKPIENFASSSTQKTEKIASASIEEITDSNNTVFYIAGGIGLLILANMIM